MAPKQSYGFGSVKKIQKKATQALRDVEEQRLQKAKKYGAKRGKEGFEVEDTFLRAWEARHLISCFVSVRRATPQEDKEEKTDAWIELKGYDPFRIQIKSYPTTKTQQEKFCLLGVVLVSVLPSDRYETIRDNTLDRIRFYLRKKRQVVVF